MKPARRLIIGTAGHIDHGKTALVKALTGKNTDRLKEEQERGISIDIDFAPLRFDDGTVIGIVDVPGHERFVRNMVAGAAGIDGALLVIDIREGVMPQTLEHVQILELLGVSRGIVALTKCDLVDAEWVANGPELIRDELRDTLFAEAEFICTSAKTGQGITELKNQLSNLAQQIEVKEGTGPFRMPVDKKFSIPGFGTVVSGTVWHGSVQIGDHIECVPNRESVRVRGIQVHGCEVDHALAGERVALNLSGVKTDVHRGSVIVSPGILDDSNLLDVRIEVSRTTQNELHHREVVHVHLGTAEVNGRVLLLETDLLRSGTNGFAQLLLDKSIAAQAGDRFVLRGGTPLTTIAGGRIIDSTPVRIHRRNRLDIIAAMTAKDTDSPLQRIMAMVMSDHLLIEADVCRQLQLSSEEAHKILIEMTPNILIHRIPSGWLNETLLTQLLEGFATKLLEVHQQNQFLNHVSKSVVISQMRTILAGYTSRDMDWLIEEGQKRGLWIVDSFKISSTKWKVQLTQSEEQLLTSVLDVLMQANLCPPTEDELCISYGKQAGIIKLLLLFAKEQGLIVSPAEGVYWHIDAFHKAIVQIRSLCNVQNRFTVGGVRDALSISRKYTVMLLEYLDKVGVTRRVGDERILLQDVTNS